MPILTIESIRKNPWSVVTHSLPAPPSRLLLEAAHLAATYCRQSEYMLMRAARESDYEPLGWVPGKGNCDNHEESEACSFHADQKVQEICDLCEREFGVALQR